MSTIKLLSFLLCLTPLAAVAQDGTRVGGPVSGFIFEVQSGELRPMVGVPGSSYLGAALLSSVQAAAVSPDGAAALAVSEGRLLLVSGLRTTAPATAPVAAALAGVDRIVWSPDGSWAAVYASGSGQAQVIRDAGRAPAPGAVIDCGSLTSLAVGAAGDLVAGMEDGVYLLAAGSAPRLIAPAARPAAMVARGTSLFVADTGAGRILQVEHFATSPAASTFAEGLESPVGVQLSADGKRLFAAAAGTRSLSAYDVAARTAVARVELECTPSQLLSFGARDTWLLNSDRSGPDPLFVGTGAGDPAAWFVPAGREQ
jgi:hypothetical protein